jgi:nitrogen regulatory protein P-II 1
MNLIIAIIRPSKLDDVKEALNAISIRGMTVSEAKGFGRTGGKSEIYRGSAYVVDFVPKIRVDVVVPSAMVQEVVDAIMGSARTGKVGDGKLFVVPVAQVFRIRTGETGEDAI